MAKKRTPQELARIKARKEFVQANPELDPAEARKRFYVQTRVQELSKSGVEVTKERRAALRQKFLSGGVQRQGFYTPADIAKFTGGSNNNNNPNDGSATVKPSGPRNVTPSMRGALPDWKPGNVKASTNNVGIYKAAQNTKKNTQTYNQIVAGLTKKGISPDKAAEMAKMLPGVYERTDAKYLGSSNADKLASDVKDALYSASGMATFREGQETRKENEVKGFFQEALGIGIMAANAYALIRGGKGAFKKFNTPKYGGVPQLGPGQATAKQITAGQTIKEITATRVVPQIEGVKPPLQLNRGTIELGPVPTTRTPAVKANKPVRTKANKPTRTLAEKNNTVVGNVKTEAAKGKTKVNNRKAQLEANKANKGTKVTQEDVQLANYADKPVAGTIINLPDPGKGGNPFFRQSAQPTQAGKTIEWVRGATSQAPVPQSLAEVKAVVTPKAAAKPAVSAPTRTPFRTKFASQEEFNAYWMGAGRSAYNAASPALKQSFINQNQKFLNTIKRESAARALKAKVDAAAQKAAIVERNAAEGFVKTIVPKSQQPLRQPVKKAAPVKKAPVKKLAKNKKNKAK